MQQYIYTTIGATNQQIPLKVTVRQQQQQQAAAK